MIATSEWPRATIDAIHRLRALEAALPGLVVVTRTIPASFDTVWATASDLERTLPALGGGYVTACTITARDGEELTARARGRGGLRDTFAITMRPGWCWMEGRLLSAGMAAVGDADTTAFAWAARLRVPGGRLLAPVTKRALTRTLQRLEARVLAPPSVRRVDLIDPSNP